MQIPREPLTFDAARDAFVVFETRRDNDLIPQNHKVISVSSAQLRRVAATVSWGGQESIAVETPKMTASLCKTETQTQLNRYNEGRSERQGEREAIGCTMKTFASVRGTPEYST